MALFFTRRRFHGGAELSGPGAAAAAALGSAGDPGARVTWRNGWVGGLGSGISMGPMVMNSS